jgi:hypothetical protein
MVATKEKIIINNFKSNFTDFELKIEINQSSLKAASYF